MERIGHVIKYYKETTEIYKYTDLKEREKHLEDMQLYGWKVVKTERREELGFAVMYQKETQIEKEWVIIYG